MCAKPEDFYLYGAYDTQKASQFNIQFIKCHDQTYCKSEKEIKEFIHKKYLLMLSNKIVFKSQEYGEASIGAESAMSWLRIS